MNVVSDRSFVARGGRFLCRKYGLTRQEAEPLALSSAQHRILAQVEAWRHKHALPASCGPVRGFLLETLAKATTMKTLPLIEFSKAANGDLIMTPTAEGIAEAKELLTDGRSPDARLYDLLDWHTSNGWMWIPPEAIGALTDAPILSEEFTLDDEGNYRPTTAAATVYAFMNYCVEDPVASWAEGKSTRWVRG